MNKILIRWAAIILVNAVLLGLVFLAAEYVAKLTEPKTLIVGGNSWRKDPVLGFDNSPGSLEIVTDEFKNKWHVNAQGMNDEDVGDIEKSKVRVMVVGDSHTAAVGVSYNEAYPYLLKKILFDGNIENGTVYNCAVPGYSLGQYLLRIRQLAGSLKPQTVIVGFSMATDLYDLTPPRLGGFVYGSEYGRVYFDLDENGKLVQEDELVGKDLKITEAQKRTGSSIKIFLATHSALYRRFKRSGLATFVAIGVLRDESLWPGVSTAVKKSLAEDDMYRWALAEALIKEIVVEAKNKNMKVVLVNIPYLPQVYDGMWNVSYGLQPKIYDRFIGGRRLSVICKSAGAYYVDTTQPFIDAFISGKKMLHYRGDGHPNAEGHKLIAKIVGNYILENKLVEASQ